MDFQKAPKTIFIRLNVTTQVSTAVEIVKCVKRPGDGHKTVVVLPQAMSKEDTCKLSMVSDKVLILSETDCIKDHRKKGDIVVLVDPDDEPASVSIYSHIPETSEQDTASWVAVVGMACRFPQANTLDEYWSILEKGTVTAAAPPFKRVTVTDTSICGNFLSCPLDEFDAEFFRLSPEEAVFVDPQTRLLLETTWEGFEDAKINPEEFRAKTVMTFYGSRSFDHDEKYMDSRLGATTAWIPFFYRCTGTYLFLDAACSCSGVALELAVKSLRKSECSLAVVASTNIIRNMGIEPNLLAPDGKCKSFSDQANGYERAEGVAVLLLKRYQDAIENGDNMHGIIRGVGCFQEGVTESVGTPTSAADCLAMQNAFQDAGIYPNQVDVLEAHGAGNPIEAVAISQAYFSSAARDSPLLIVSGKANIGHTEACAGLAGMIKVMLSMRHEAIPKQVYLETINPGVDFSSVPAVIPTEDTNWPRNPRRPRIAGVSNFGNTGTNVHIILQEPPYQSHEKRIRTYTHPLVLPLSAKTDAALAQLAAQFAKFCLDDVEEAADICYTASVCRPHHPVRCAVVEATSKEIGMRLQKQEMILPEVALASEDADRLKVCFSFPGYMDRVQFCPTRELYKNYAPFREEVDKCNLLFQQCYPNKFPTFGHLLLSDEENIPFKELEIQAGLQGVLEFGLMITVQVSLAKLWIRWGVQPDVVLGYSTGDISAAVVSGALTLKSAFKLLKVHNVLIDRYACSKTSILMVREGVSEVEKLLMQFIEQTGMLLLNIGCDNCSIFVSVVGPYTQIIEFELFCRKQEIMCVRGSLPFPAHSPTIKFECTRVMPILSMLEYDQMTTKWVSSSTGKLVESSELGPGFWEDVISERVEFKRASAVAREFLGSKGVFLEMGYCKVLTNFTRQDILPPSNIVCFASLFPFPETIWITLGEVYARGAEVQWSAVYPSGGSTFRKVTLPGYCFQRKSIPYKPITQQLLGTN